MFETSIYQERRAELAEKIGYGVIILLGNDESSMNYKDNVYLFRQDSTFLYYFVIHLGLYLFYQECWKLFVYSPPEIVTFRPAE